MAHSLDIRAQLSRRRFLQTSTFAGFAALVPPLIEAQNPVGNIFGEGLPACRVHYPKVKPAYPLDGRLIDTFRELSEVLTGVNRLDPHLAKAYATRVAETPILTSSLPKLLDAFRQIQTRPKQSWEREVVARIMNPPASQLRQCAEQVIYAWYFSALFLPDPKDATKKVWVYGDPEHY